MGVIVAADLTGGEIFLTFTVEAAEWVDLRLIPARGDLWDRRDPEKWIYFNCRLRAVSLFFFS